MINFINFKDIKGKEYCEEVDNIAEIKKFYANNEIHKALIKLFAGNDILVDRTNYEKIQKQLKNYEETFIGMTKIKDTFISTSAKRLKKMIFFVSDIMQLIYQPNGKYHYLAKVPDYFDNDKTHDIYITEEQYNYLQKRIGKNNENQE